MKSSTRFIFGLTLLLLPALGYGQGVSGAFRITGKDIRVTEDFLSLELDINAFHLSTGKGSSLELFPVLRSGGNEKILPGISYRGSGYTAPENRAPFFAVYRDIVRDQQYNTSYSAGLSYESWMDSASLEFRQYLATEGLSVELSRKQMVRNITINHPRAGTLWSIDKNLLPDMVEFLKPEDEMLKMRSMRFSAGIDYPVGKAGVLPGYGSNVAELDRIGTLMNSILTDSLVAVRSITITGYSSPEGSYAANERLSRGRSEGFSQYLAAAYPLGNIPVHTDWVAEDWNGLGLLVEASSNITEKQKVLDIIRNPDILPDTKDGQLQKIAWWSDNYRVILKEMYPRLRRIEVCTDYEVRPLSDNQAKELLYSRPGVLSLSEMMRVASSCEPGSGQYREVFEIAARHFPDDIAANNNAAAALLLEGDAQGASLYLEKVGMLSDRRMSVNRGVACYITGDTVKAREYFTEACHSGMDKGCRNLELLNASLSATQAEVASGFGSPLFMSISHDGRPESESYRFAVKTNLLYDIALLPNLALEFPLGRRWSMEVEGQWSWWNTKTTHNNCWRIQTIGLEARKWLGSESLIPLTGHYLGIYGMAGTYDVKFSNKNGYLSDMSYSMGISYGYSLPVSRVFNLEFGIAAGYLGGRYKVYDQYDPQNKMFPLKEKRNMHYFGPTKGKVSLVWIIGGR